MTTRYSPPEMPQYHRYDLIIIPLLMVATLAVLAVVGEVCSRIIFVESGSETCSMIGPAGVGVMRPNCTSYRKAAEGPPTVNAYNDCGYRTPQPCHTRLPGEIRVALMGTSTAAGMKVPYPDTFAARLTQALTDACHRPVDFQDMGIPGASLAKIFLRTDEALAMRPNLVMLVITPVEMRGSEDDGPSNRAKPASVGVRADRPGMPSSLRASAKSLVSRISDLAYQSRLLVVAQHFLFQDRATYIRLYLMHGDEADYLRLPYSRAWRQRLDAFDKLLGDMAAKIHAAGVPMMLVLAPARIQAALLDPSLRPPNVDPFALGRDLAAIAARHEVAFQDTLQEFTRVARPDDMFYAVDGHIDGDGNALLARAIYAGLLHASGPFADCAAAHFAQSQMAAKP